MGSHLLTAEAQDNPFPFWGLMLFTFVLFVAPQFIFPVLQSISPAKLSAGLALVVYLIDCLSGGRPLTVRSSVVRLVVWLVVIAVLSIPFSRWPGGSADAFLDEFVKSVLIFLLVANTVNTVHRMKLMMGSMGVWGTIMAWTAIRDYSTGNLMARGVRIRGYESPLASDPNDLSLTLNLIIPLLIGLCLGAEKPTKKILLVATMLILIGAVIASFSRGGFLALSALLLAFLVKEIKRRGASALVPFLILLPIVLLVLPQGYGDRIYSIYDTSSDDGSANARWDGMVLGINLMLERPLLGLGFNMHSLAFPERGLGWQGIHSAFIQTGADMGVPGFLVYILLVWELFKELHRSRTLLKDRPNARELLGLVAGLEIALVAYVVGGFLLPVAYRFYLYYIAGFTVALNQLAQRMAAPPAGGVLGRPEGNELNPHSSCPR